MSLPYDSEIGALLCPVCGGDCNHPMRVVVGPIDDDKFGVEISREGVRTKRGLRPSHGFSEGVGVGIEMGCEGGHFWFFFVGFTDGVTHAESIATRDVESKERPIYTLWTD